MFQSYNTDGCGDCSTPPESFSFEIVDDISGENFFTNGTYNPAQIRIVNTLNNAQLEFSFIGENNINLIQISSIGWQTEIENKRIDISDEPISNL